MCKTWILHPSQRCQLSERRAVSHQIQSMSGRGDSLNSVRQMNMDYVLSQSLQRLGGIPLVIVLYDVMCQYWKNLKKRVDQSPHLHLDPDLVMHKGIGLFHVHGHKDECMPMFAPTYIPGAGNVDGEILETLWAPIEKVSGSTRSMTASHRQETLDDHMNDSNWKKLVGMGKSISICDVCSVGEFSRSEIFVQEVSSCQRS